MPISGTGSILGAALKSAVDQVTAQAVAAGSPVDRDAVFAAMGAAIVAHIVANSTVVGACPGGAGGPLVAGLIT